MYEPGLSRGDMIFDVAAGGLGADKWHPFKVVELQTKNPAATVKATVEDGSSLLILEFTHFTAGDRLVFSIDVDEVVHMEYGETDIHKINQGIDPIASGVEFQGTDSRPSSRRRTIRTSSALRNLSTTTIHWLTL